MIENYLIDNYQGDGTFVLKENEVKMGLKNMTLISEMKVVKTNFKPTEASYSTFSARYFSKIKNYIPEN